jgi:hypothetical protein
MTQRLNEKSTHRIVPSLLIFASLTLLPSKVSAKDSSLSTVVITDQVLTQVQVAAQKEQQEQEVKQLLLEKTQFELEKEQSVQEAEQLFQEAEQIRAEQEGRSEDASISFQNAKTAQRQASWLRELSESKKVEAQQAKDSAQREGETAKQIGACRERPWIGRASCFCDLDARANQQRADDEKHNAARARIHGLIDDASRHEELSDFFLREARKGYLAAWGYLARNALVAGIGIGTFIISFAFLTLFIYRKYRLPIQPILRFMKRLLGEEELKGLKEELDELSSRERPQWILNLLVVLLLCNYFQVALRIARQTKRMNKRKRR